MQRAIAGGGRLCQAALGCALLMALCPCVQAQRAAATRTTLEARTRDGIVVQETCLAGAPGPGESPCGTLAKRAVDVIERLTTLLGPYPQKTLKLLPVRAEGLKYVVGRGEIRATEDVFRFAGADEVLPDELPRAVATQWLFTGPNSIKAEDAWLPKGIAEYAAWRYLRERNPPAAQMLVAKAMRDGPADTVQWALDRGVTSAEHPSERSSVAARGMLVLRTLETAIDRERVDRVLPEFLQRASDGSLSTKLFETVCEGVARRNLAWFFDYFVRGKQIPTMELRSVPSESAAVAAAEIVLKDFPTEGSVRVEMVVHTAQGNVEHSVATHGPVTPFTVNVPSPALSIALDPDMRILRWTEAARRSQAQGAILTTLPAHASVPERIAAYRRALAADPDDASLRAQSLNKELGELEWVNDEHDAALAAFDAAINGHSIAPFETYSVRANALLWRASALVTLRRLADAREDARAGLALPPAVLAELADVNRKAPAKTLRAEFEELLKAPAGPR